MKGYAALFACAIGALVIPAPSQSSPLVLTKSAIETSVPAVELVRRGGGERGGGMARRGGGFRRREGGVRGRGAGRHRHRGRHPNVARHPGARRDRSVRRTAARRRTRPGTCGRWARPANYWWRPGGAVAAGAAIGFVTAATAYAWAGAPPSPGMCWYYTDASRTNGFWDACPR